jgi:alpha-L-arabinofuranosidase
VVPFQLRIDTGYSTVNGTILSSEDPNAFNFRNNQTAIVPKPLDIPASATKNKNGAFKWQVPAWSITILQFNA